MKIMGIDASTTAIGYSVFDNGVLIASGCLRPNKNEKEWRGRIQELSILLNEKIALYSPDRLYAEDVPLKKGSSTIQKLATMQGVILALCTFHKVEVCFLLPSNWRGSLGIFDGTREGTHREILKKKAVEMANSLFNKNLLWVSENSKKNEDDEAEGILIAYSQIQTKRGD